MKTGSSGAAANVQCADDDRDNICRAIHSMDVLYNQTLRQLDKSFRRLEAMLPPPQRMRHGNSFVYRYKEKTVHQALIQKLARMVSGLHAARDAVPYGSQWLLRICSRCVIAYHGLVGWGRAAISYPRHGRNPKARNASLRPLQSIFSRDPFLCHRSQGIWR